jgi:glycosyltransferase involved in cell wall biosynthesis
MKPTVVHTNGMKMHLLATLFRIDRVPVIWHMRDYIGQRKLMAPSLRVLSRRADAVIAISRSVAADANHVLGRRDAVVVYNAVDVGTFNPEGERLDIDVAANRSAANVSLRVGLVATYARWKGHELFLDAIAYARAELPTARFYIVGGPAYGTRGSQYSRAELEAAVEQRGLASAVAFVSFQDQPQAAYRALDVAVHASTRPEPFGRTIAEAMACGRPVVAAREGGASEIVTDGVNGLAVAPRDAHALAAAIVKLARAPELRAQLGLAARRRAEQAFSHSRLGREVLDVYRSIGWRP